MYLAAVLPAVPACLQTVEVTLHAPGGHSSMPRSDDMGARVGAFLSAMTASPPPPRLVSPTREFVLGLADLSASPWLAIVSKLGTVGFCLYTCVCVADLLIQRHEASA